MVQWYIGTICQYGKADDSKERYNRFMRFFSAWGKIRYFEDVTDANILALDEHLAKKGLKPYSKSNAWKTHTRRCGDFRGKPMNLFSLVKHHVYNKVYPCVCFCKGNCS